MNVPYSSSFRGLSIGIALFIAAIMPSLAQQPHSLPGFDADLTQTSISGLSSGGFMAAQFEVAFSKSLIGAGIVAGGPFYCAGSSSLNSYLKNATTTCMKPVGPGPDAAKLLRAASQFATAGKIDRLDGLKNHRVYLFSGSSDATVTTKVVDQTRRFLELAGVPRQNIKYVKTLNAGHGLITDRASDLKCSATAPPFINDCDYQQSHDILRQIYGNLNPPASTLSGKVVAFDQREFIDSDRSSMSDAGYAYVPAECGKERCRVHVALHGCQQGAALIGDRYYSGTGYNEIADTNRIIVLYPQAQPSDPIPYNPKGCWDFWGYSSTDSVRPNFFAKDAPQLKALEKMIQRLGEPRAKPNS